MSMPSLPSLLVSHWQLAWSLDVEAAAAASLYLWATRRVRVHWPVHRTVSFLAGIGCGLVALQSGIDAYDEQLLSVHMVQHMLLLLVVPVLLLAGQPLLLALRALRPRHRKALARALTRSRPYLGPAPSMVFFSAVILITHLSSFYDATLRHGALHDFEHGLYVVAGLLVWWQILGADPVPSHRLGGLGKLVYMLVAMVPMALVGAYLNRHATLVYPAYGPPARSLGISALNDQSQAGAIMWVLGNTIMAVVGVCGAVAALVADERRQRARDARAAVLVDAAQEDPLAEPLVLPDGRAKL
jgi:putative membrane protein